MTGADFNLWLIAQPNSNGLRALAHRLGRNRRYPWSILDWSEAQVDVIYREVTRQAEGGLWRWGGAANPQKLAPK